MSWTCPPFGQGPRLYTASAAGGPPCLQPTSVTHVTQTGGGRVFNRIEGLRGYGRSPNQRTSQMVLAIVVTLIVTAALGNGFRRERGGALIVRHPYNNRYNDATAAREADLEG